MSLAPGDIVQVKFYGEIFGQRTITTFDYAVLTAASNPDVIALTQAIADYADNGAGSVGIAFYDVCPQNWTCDFITAQKVFPVPYRAQMSITGLPGLDANDATTANTAASIEKASIFAGRQEVGRVSIPALAPFNQDDGMILAGFLTKMNTLALAMKGDWTNPLIDPTLVLRPCIVHRVKDGTPPKWRIRDYSEVSTTYPKDTVRTQRTRNMFKGI